MKFVLMVVHNYPPIYGAGAEPPLKFSQHLSKFGFEPIILTTGRYGGLTDDSQRHVYRANDCVYSLFAQSQDKTQIPQEERYRSAVISNTGWTGRLRDKLMIPDTKIGWLLPAVRLGEKLIKQYRPAIIFSTSPPETTHLVALQLSQSHTLPWVADLRDGWLFEPPQAALREPPFRQWIEKRLESQVVEKAMALVTATVPITQDLKTRYCEIADKVTTITNGYDQAEFDGIARKRQSDDRFLLVHTGALASSRQGTSAQTFFSALALLLRDQPQLPIHIQFIGATNPAEQTAVRDFGLSDRITFIPPVSRCEAHQYQIDADILLLITAPGQRSVATLKLFDYIGAGIPILALAENNAAADIIQQYRLGITVSPKDPHAIAHALTTLMDRRRVEHTWPGFVAAQQDFEWQTLTRQLAQIFDQTLQQ